MAFIRNNKSVIASTLVGSLLTGAGALALAQQDVPGVMPEAEPDDRAPHAFTGKVVDLHTYLKKTQEDIQRQIDNPARSAEDEDVGIDWSRGEYKENIKHGVPMVLMIEESSPWGEATKRPHVVAFDPDDSDSRDAHKKLKDRAGEKVEVTGEVHKDGAIRGLRIILVDGYS